jgi:hypothetical protein
MKKHWHKALFDFELSLLVTFITQLLSDVSACKFIKHHEKIKSSHLKDINLGESTPKLIASSFVIWYLLNIINISFQKFINLVFWVQM